MFSDLHGYFWALPEKYSSDSLNSALEAAEARRLKASWEKLVVEITQHKEAVAAAERMVSDLPESVPIWIDRPTPFRDKLQLNDRPAIMSHKLRLLIEDRSGCRIDGVSQLGTKSDESGRRWGTELAMGSASLRSRKELDS